MCSHTKASRGTTPSTTEPAAPIGATMCIKAEAFLAPSSGTVFSQLWLCLLLLFLRKELKNRIEIVVFPSEEAEAELHSPLPQGNA